MASINRELEPLCDINILKTKRVCLVKEVMFEHVMPSIQPFLMYRQVDMICSEKMKCDKIGKILDILERFTTRKQYAAFNAFIRSLAGTQPDLFQALCERPPTVSESDFCMRKVSLKMREVIENTKHHTDSDLDEQINFEYEYVELAIVDKHHVCVDQDRQRLPHEYNVHLSELQQRNRTISAWDLLGTKNKECAKVSIYGRAGVGKSTTMQFWARQWALGRWALHFTMLFLLQLRFVTHQVIAITTVELLSLYSLYDFPDHSDPTAFTSWLKNCACRILILIDGLDEIPGFADRMRNTPRIHDVFQKAHPVDLIINILRGDLLKGCTVISASRPFSGLSTLPADVKAEVLGLTSAKVTEFVEHRHPHHQKNIMSVLRKSPILLSVCGITFYCMLISRLLSEGVMILDEDVKTYTRLMSFVIVQYCSRKITADSSFLLEVTPYFAKLAQLANSGIFQLNDNAGLAKLVFDENDLVNSMIGPEDIDQMKKTGIFQISRKKFLRYESLSAEFFHLSAQELLGVAHLLSHPPFDDNILKQLFHSGQFNLALQFIFGLHFDRNNNWIEAICRAVRSTSESHGIEDKLSSFLDSLIMESSTKGEKLQVYQLIHEGQWMDKAKEVVHLLAPNGALEIRHSAMTAIDLLAVYFVCKHSWLSSIALWDVQADDTFVDVLLSSLCENNRETLEELNLERNNIGDAGVAAIGERLCRGQHESMMTLPILKSLNMSKNNIGRKGAKSMAGALANNDSLQELYLCGNEIDKEGVMALANSLSHNASLKKLELAVDEAGIEAVAEMLQHNTCLEVLTLSYRDLNDSGIKVLADGLHQNTTLIELYLLYGDTIGNRRASARGNEVGEEGLKALSISLSSNTGLKKLKLEYRYEDGSGVEAAAQMLQENTCLEVLDLRWSSLGNDGIKLLAAGLHGTNTLKELNLDGNEMGDAGAAAIATMLSHNSGLQRLDISDNQIGDEGAQAIAQGLVTNTSLRALNISGQSHVKTGIRCLGDAGAVAMADLLKKNNCLVELNMSDNNIGDIGANATADAFRKTEDAETALAKYNTTLKELVIHTTSVGPDGRKALDDITQPSTYLKVYQCR